MLELVGSLLDKHRVQNVKVRFRKSGRLQRLDQFRGARMVLDGDDNVASGVEAWADKTGIVRRPCGAGIVRRTDWRTGPGPDRSISKALRWPLAPSASA